MSFFSKIIQQVRRPRVKYEPLVEVRISREALIHNYQTLRKKFPKLRIAPVLKSNAYGHGLTETALVFDELLPPFFMVDSFYEALVLRRAGIRSKILILGYLRPEQILEESLENIAFGLTSLDTLQLVAHELLTPRRFHLKIDTGMNRQGIEPEETEAAIELILSNPNIILEGLCTHLADADDPDQGFTRRQIKSWNAVVPRFRAKFPDIRYFHSTATPGIYYADQMSVNVARLGVGLLGINRSPFLKLNLKPALEMRSIVSSVRTVRAGENIGYSRSYTAPFKMRVATVPVGYYEGLNLRLTNKGWMRVGNNYCPIVGRVSMNMSTIDVTAVGVVRPGDPVEVISSDPAGKNSVEIMARLCNTMVYEILTGISPTLRRVVV